MFWKPLGRGCSFQCLAHWKNANMCPCCELVWIMLSVWLSLFLFHSFHDKFFWMYSLSPFRQYYETIFISNVIQIYYQDPFPSEKKKLKVIPRFNIFCYAVTQSNCEIIQLFEIISSSCMFWTIFKDQKSHSIWLEF